MNILVTGANGQLGNEMRIVSQNTTDHYIFTDVNQVEGLETLPSVPDGDWKDRGRHSHGRKRKGFITVGAGAARRSYGSGVRCSRLRRKPVFRKADSGRGGKKSGLPGEEFPLPGPGTKNASVSGVTEGGPGCCPRR